VVFIAATRRELLGVQGAGCETTDQILGAHCWGERRRNHQLFALAMRAGMTGRQFRNMVLAYPTRTAC